MDLISQLPEALLHEILHLLPEKDSVRTCVLSKAWCGIQSRSPFLWFDEFDFPAQSLFEENTLEAILEDRKRKELFADYINRRLQRLLSQKDSPPLELFMLSVIEFDPLNDPPRIDSWLKRVSEKGVKCIILRHMGENDSPLNLPRCVFASQTLHELTLADCAVNFCGDIEIPSLRNLILFNVNVDDDVMKCFISGCPLLEILSISFCDALTCLQANNLAMLKIVVLHYCSFLKKVEILSPNVQSFEYKESSGNCSEEAPKLILALSTSIKKITLVYANITSDCLQQYIPTCEELVLVGIPGFESAKISGKDVSKLTIEGSDNMTKVPVIDCPNLQSLVYAQNKLPFHAVQNFKLRNTKLEFNLDGKQEFDAWLAELKGFFDNLNSKLELIMVIGSKEYEANELMLPVLYDFKDSMPKAKVIISNSLELDKLMDEIFSFESHVSSVALNVASAHSSNSIFSQLVRMKADENCCKEGVFRCWRHYSCNLKKDYASNSIPAVLKSYKSEQYQITKILVKREEATKTNAIPQDF
ncbi:hypothetical protein L6164_004308 [Bauhinia variegata]|uniref:Uncharacterized protein n=1 Tax=Bauhinia variegata TaxID=167791 RepID=A0ACB9Q677_BAUVA|nr:hypothetical protein L6164_004308 [Bauhinia variegata]